jgi:hypothetical protein
MLRWDLANFLSMWPGPSFLSISASHIARITGVSTSAQLPINLLILKPLREGIELKFVNQKLHSFYYIALLYCKQNIKYPLQYTNKIDPAPVLHLFDIFSYTKSSKLIL